ncbi:hypothetical protein V8E54_014917 [Elaphomyces granulatus]
MRIKEKCIYEIGIRNRSSQKSHTEHDSRSENGILESRIDQSSAYSEKPANNDSSNFGGAAKQITPGISPVSGPLSYHGSSSNVESNFPSSNTSPALSPQPKHRSLNLAYSNVPSWEEALQEASDNGRNHLWGIKTGVTAQQPATDQYHRGVKWSSMSDSPIYEPPFHETVAMDEFPTRPQTPQSDRSILPSDYLSVRRGARVRYIGKAFWGIVTGRESLSDDFFDENHDPRLDTLQQNIASFRLANLLRSLPTKPVCDVLVFSFLVGVRPIYPLVHVPTFQTNYDELWEFYRNGDTPSLPEKLLDDPTFICLLLAVLYSGASAAPALIWASPELQGLKKEMIVNHLKTAYSTSLSMCHHIEHPTFNTLVSSLLTHPFMEPEGGSLGSAVFVSTVVRLAESMGMHREDQLSRLDAVTRELRRRVWWHIVWLDVQSSISSGLPTCCGNEALDAVRMVAETRDENISHVPQFSSPDPSIVVQSVTMLYAVGRYETARLQYSLINNLQSARGMTQESYAEIAGAAKKLQYKIDTLIARIPAQGIPEKGLIPSRLANASLLTHPTLYEDTASHPTVFATWVRIMLTMLKLEVAILLQKPFLGHPDSKNPQEQKSWTSIAQLSVDYLRSFLQLHRAPAFAPYMWFCSSYYGPLQCAFLTLIYLNHNRESENAQLARYCVDELIDHCISDHQQLDNDSIKEGPDNPTLKAQQEMISLTKKVLINLHKKLDLPPENDERPPRPFDPLSCRFQSSSSLHFTSTRPNSMSIPLSATSSRECDLAVTAAVLPLSGHNSHSMMPDSSPTHGFLHNISELEAWCSLIQDTGKFPSLGQDEVISLDDSVMMPL